MKPPPHVCFVLLYFLFGCNFPNWCKYVLGSIRPNNIQSSEDSHQSSEAHNLIKCVYCLDWNAQRSGLKPNPPISKQCLPECLFPPASARHGCVSMRTFCGCLFTTVRGKSAIARARTAIYLVQQSNLSEHVFFHALIWISRGFFYLNKQKC